MAFEPPPTQATQALAGGRLLKDLLAGFFADHGLEVAHHRRVGMRAERRTEQVVGVADIGHPIADGLVDRVFQRAAAALHRAHLRAQQAHAQHVGLLAGDIDRAHVDHALQPQQRGDGGGGHAVLAGPGLGDDALLAHARASSAWPRALLILCAPECARSSRLR
jgi:hypothetical protein